MKYFSFSNKVHFGAFVIILCVSFLFLCNFDTSTSRIIDEIFEYGHLPLFGVISLGFAVILNRNQTQATLRPYLLAWIITAGLGIATEVIQIITPGRYFEIRDMVFDALGAGCFLTLAYPFPGKGIRIKKIFRAAALTVILAGTIPIFFAASDEITMHNSFPLIGSFESRLEMGRWGGTDSGISRSTLHATHGQYSLVANLLPGEYPGISLNYLKRDWRGYTRLTFDAFLVGNDPLRITARINDKDHNDEYDDRYNKSFVLDPGSNEIVIDLKEVMAAPKGRDMDMGNIVNICVFSYHLGESRTLYFDNFRLQ